MIKQKQNRIDLLFLMMVLSVMLFVLYPMLCIIHKSVWIEGAWTVSEYRELLGKNRILLQHSLFTGVCSAVISTAAGVLIALQTATATKKKKMFFMAVLLMTMVSPPFISSLVYIQLYGRRGWITWRLLKLSLNPYNKWGIIAMQSLHFTSLNALFLTGCLGKINPSLVYAAKDLGSDSESTIHDVILPMIRPAIGVCFLLSLIRSIADFGTPTIIGGRYNTLATEIYMQLIGYSHLEKASAMNMLLLIPAVIVFVGYRLLMKDSDRLLSGAAAQSESKRLPLKLKGLTGIVVRMCAFVFYTMMILQYGCIFILGFLKSRKGNYYFSMENVTHFLNYNMGSLLRSVEYALIVAVFGTLFGILLAYYLERYRKTGSGLLDFIVSLPYLLPGTCFGIGYILAFNKKPVQLTGTAAIIIINMTFKQLPMIVRTTGASLVQLSERIEDAGRDLGAGRYAIIRDIVLPNLKPAFLTGFAYNFSSAMTTAGAVIFLISARHKLAVYTLFDVINSGEYGIAALISSAMILITLLVTGIAYVLLGRRS